MTEPERDGRLLVVVASRNPVKLDATGDGFRLLLPDRGVEIIGSDVPSGVSDQPWSDAETRQGAANRAAGARAEHPDADFWVGIEGGLAGDGELLESFAWVVIESAADRVPSRSRTASFPLPRPVAASVLAGHELGDAIDEVFDQTNSKQHQGAVGALTGGVIDRRGLYRPSVVMALAPLVGPAAAP